MKQVVLLIVVLALLSTAVVAQSANANPRAFEASLKHFQANAKAYGITNALTDLKGRKSLTDEFGVTHIRFDQHHRGVKVFEGEAISHVDRTGRVRVTNALRKGLNLDVKPGIARQAAIDSAVHDLGLAAGYKVLKSDLAILPQGERSPVTRLVYHVQIYTEDELNQQGQWDYFVDARSGEIVFSFNSLETSASTATGKTMFIGPQTLNVDLLSGTYYMRDLTRGGGNYACDMKNRTTTNCSSTIITRTTPTFGDGVVNSSDRATAAADAAYGLQATWDYYKNMFGRNGIDGNGRKTYLRVHYGRNYENASWNSSCFCMTYGDGATTFYPLVSLDVAAHEMSHGVMSTEAALTYSGESGGLNEGNSDIFGALVEFAVNSTIDTPDWWIGERIYRSNYSTGSYVQNKALRYMNDPRKDGMSPACWTSSLGSMDVHYSSGPINHFFYLLANPAANVSKCDGATVTGIGLDKAARIWYRAVTVEMTSGTNYAGARIANLNSAAALYGAGSPEYNAVAAAFAAIGVK